MAKYRDSADWAINNYDMMVYRSPRELAEIVWKAACEHQRAVDIEIVRNEAVNGVDETDESYNLALTHAADAIASQE